jgi:hypothetical protein
MILDFKTTKRDACQRKGREKNMEILSAWLCWNVYSLFIGDDAKGVVTRKKMDKVTFLGTLYKPSTRPVKGK